MKQGAHGLQKHSQGDNYPLTIMGKGHPTQYAAFNCLTGQTGHWRRTQQEALMDIASIRIRNMMHG